MRSATNRKGWSLRVSSQKKSMAPRRTYDGSASTGNRQQRKGRDTEKSISSNGLRYLLTMFGYIGDHYGSFGQDGNACLRAKLLE